MLEKRLVLLMSHIIYEGNILVGGLDEILSSEEAKRVYLGSEFNI